MADKHPAGATYQEEECVLNLPSTVVAKVASYVPWQTKLKIVEGVPEWSDHICNSESWNVLKFEDMPSNSVNEIRKKFVTCLTSYGKYISDIHIVFRHEIDLFVEDLFEALLKFGVNVKILRLTSVYFCVDSIVDLFIKTIKNMPKLLEVHLLRPRTYLHSQNNIIAAMYRERCTHFLRTLELMDSSFENFDFRPIAILKHFTSLQKIRLKRDRLSKQVLIHLSKHSLNDVSLFQDEETPLLDAERDPMAPLLYDEGVWEEVRKNQPNFRVNLIVKNMYILRSLFPAHAPITSLVFVDIPSSVTKGLLDHVIENYASTLEIFVYSWTCDIDLLVSSHLRLDDRRVPAYLPEFVRSCPRLHTLVYGYEISTVNILLTAEVRKLNNFVLSLEALNFEFNRIDPEWPNCYIEWLQESSKSVESVEHTVSTIYGCEWRIATPIHMAYAVEYYCNV